jgi:hypothetical protein
MGDRAGLISAFLASRHRVAGFDIPGEESANIRAKFPQQ